MSVNSLKRVRFIVAESNPTASCHTGTNTNPRCAWLYVAFLLSGVAGLGFEVVWARMWSIGLGHEVPSILAVVAAFFGGFALGAWLLDHRVSTSPRPRRWYIGLELLIGIWGLVATLLIPWANDAIPGWIGLEPSPLRHWLIAFAVPVLVLLPATMAMGATLPAMDRVVAAVRGNNRAVPGLYAVNTLGAVAGTLVSTHVLVPAMGLSGAAITLALLNFACVGIVMMARTSTAAVAAPKATVRTPSPMSSARVYLTLLATGLLGIGYEVLGIRVIGQVMENTVYSFASALAVFLIGTAIGAAAYQRFDPGRQSAALLTYLLEALAATCLLGVMIMASSRQVYEGVLEAVGYGKWGSVAAEIILATLVFLLPTMLMGAIFSHLALAARHARGGVGAALAINTLGGAIAPLVFGVLLLPLIGAKWSLVVVAGGYLLLIPELSPTRLLPVAVPLIFFVLLPANLHLVDPPPGGRVVEYREGVQSAVAAVADTEGRKFLKVNNRFYMGGTARGFLERRMGHVPLLLHDDPRQALFLGLGAGTTFFAASWHDNVQVDGVELLPEVIALLPHFETELDQPAPAKSAIYTADARRFVRATQQQYDVIVADLFHPSRDGSGSLYTVEHFTTICQRLAPDGLFCQWLPLHQLEPEVLRTIIRTFLHVFPTAEAYVGDFNTLHPALGLIGRTPDHSESSDPQHDPPLDAEHSSNPEPRHSCRGYFDERVNNPHLKEGLVYVAIESDFQLFGGRLGGPEALSSFAGDGPLNTDDYPIVTFAAPSLVYARAEPARDNLNLLIEHFAAERAYELNAQQCDVEYAQRMRDYRIARDFFLTGSIHRAAGQDSQAIAAYLDSSRASSDFRASYFTLLEVARQRIRSDSALSRRLLDTLIESHPHIPDASNERKRLFGE